MRYAFVPIHLAKLNYSLSTMTPYFYSPPCYYTGPSHIIPQLHYCNILLMDLFHVCLHCLLSYFVLNSAARVRLLTHKTDHVIHAQNFLMSLLSQRWSQSLFSCLQVPTQSNRPTPTVSSFLLVLSPTQFEPCFLLAAPLNRPSTFLVKSAPGCLFPSPRTLPRFELVSLKEGSYLTIPNLSPAGISNLPYCVFFTIFMTKFYISDKIKNVFLNLLKVLHMSP